jgi:uncharacterized membrane protein
MTDRTDGYRRYTSVVAAVIGILILLYSILIANQPLVGIGLLVSLYVLSLAYRFVRAHERIADAIERREERSGR